MGKHCMTRVLSIKTTKLYMSCDCCQACLSKYFRSNAFPVHPIGIGRLTGRNLRVNVNFAEQAHNHNCELDPIVRSLLDTDFYKLLMLQLFWKLFPAIHSTS